VQPVSCCHVGLLTYAEQPLPPPDQAVSVKPRVVLDRFSVVPPTSTTYWEEAGNCAP